MNNIPNIKLVTLSLFTVLILLVFSTCILNNVDAPPFGGRPHETYRPPDTSFETSRQIEIPTIEPSKPSESHNYGAYKPSEIGKEVKSVISKTILKSSIAKENLIQHSDTQGTRAEKIKQILHQLDINTLSLDKPLKDEIWRDAYTFANTVIIPIVGNIMAKFLLELSSVIFI